MRQTLMLATMAVMTACGATGNVPWDENRDGLISACEGLNPTACDATPGCEPAAVVCDLACRDDGHGGCLPCPGAETCRPIPVPPAFDCTQLNATQCLSDSRCLLAEAQTTPVQNGGGAPFAPPAPEFRLPDTRVCINRPPATCESLSTDVCLARPGCALQRTSGCESFCDPSTGSTCAPCATDAMRCVTIPPVDFCEARDPNVCTIDGRCVLEAGPVCDVACSPGAPCPPCATPSYRCVAPPPPDLCGARDVNTCTLDGRCVLQSGPICDAICDPNGSCPPCANPTVYCVPAPQPDLCGSRDLNTCELDGLCVVQAWACPAICNPDGNGGCLPCDAPPAACVPAPVPDVCGSRDPATCAIDGQCELQVWACPAVCEPDGNGGCLPCDAPPAACVPVTPVSRCSGLDRAACSLVGCEVIELDCDASCRPDGNGGCLPCDAFICSDGSSNGGSGGGTPPPAP